MRYFRREPVALIGFLLLAPVGLLAQNTTPGAAARPTIGQQAIVQPLANNTSQAWFFIQPRAGRSYCASATTSMMSVFNAGGLPLSDPLVTVFQGDATTVVAQNDDIGSEPDANFQSRACFIWPNVGSSGYVRATQLNNFAATYDVRVIETTMFCPWFFIAGDYNAFTLIRNTTDQTVGFTINWRNAAGTIVGTASSVIPGNGNIALNARDFVDHVTTASGSVEIAHNGSEDALKASTTTLSGSTGLGFDALFEQRRSQ